MLERMFNYENPVWQFMNRVADLLILNLLFMIFSIPIVTIGASYTALTYTMVKIVRKEDTYVFKEFWGSFKRNLKQATQMWLILLPFIAILSCDVAFWCIDVSQQTGLFPKALKVTTVIVVLIVLSITIYAFPILSHFDNTVRNTLKNAFLVSLINIPYTVYFILLMIIPIVIVGLEMRMIMAFIMVGFSFPSFMASLAWSKIFKKLEPPTEESEEEPSEWEVPADGENTSDTEEDKTAGELTAEEKEEIGNIVESEIANDSE